MSRHRELALFLILLTVLVGGFLGESLFLGRVLSPADVLLASAAFEEFGGPAYEPANRLLIDPVLQFQPWLEFNRTMLRSGRLPLWNDLAGCGTPHLANGQSAVFDPFHLIVYLGPLPEAYAWLAAARLVFAGLGTFLLARSWGLGPWGRWFAGLVFPFCGFVVVWLLFPVTSVAVWMPWVFLGVDRLFRHPGPRAAAGLALAVGGLLLAGHVQTSAHVLLATGVDVLWRFAAGRHGTGVGVGERLRLPDLARWALATLLGIGIAAVAIIPLGFYLARSPVWSDRDTQRPGVLTLTPPRLLDAACTALPSLYGSQRRGQPNLARALGVHNQNETAGGFAGLLTLAWLAPTALAARGSRPRIRFLAGLVAFGLLGAFEVAPVPNLLRALPVLNVMDHRRLTLWVAFGLTLLGAHGLDALRPPPRWLTAGWITAAVVLIAAALACRSFAPLLRERALAHYQQAAARTPGADPAVFRQRAERQVHQALTFLPRSLTLAAGQLLAGSVLAGALRRRGCWDPIRLPVVGLVLADLLVFGFGLNPAIDRERHRPVSRLLAYLQREAAPPSRVLALDPELPPNTLMRYGLADLRNYDSIESTAHFAAFEALYEPGPSRTSRRAVTWSGVARARPELRFAGVTAVVGPTPPPAGLFERVDRVGSLWVARLDATPFPTFHASQGRARFTTPATHPDRIRLPITYDPGWSVRIDGRPATLGPDHLGAFLAVPVPPGSHRVELAYQPWEVTVSVIVSVAMFCLAGGMLVARPGADDEPKKLPGAWRARTDRVRIELGNSTRSKSPAFPEGRHADGPLHV